MPGRPWTGDEEARLARLAGSVPLDEICEELGRSRASVCCKASEMRLRQPVAPLRAASARCPHTCPSCGAMRTSLGRTGLCRPCELRGLIERAEREADAALGAMGPEGRATYLGTASRLSSSMPPRPAMEPVPEGAGPSEAARVRDRNAERAERWEVACLTRVLNARRRRAQRMRRRASAAGDG